MSRRGLGGDEGSSVVEFLGLSLVLLVPLVYLVLVLGRLEAATFAGEGAAREAARTYVVADSADEGAARAIAAAGIALRDQGFDDDPADALTITCSIVAVPGAGQRRGRPDRRARAAAVRAGVRARRRPAGDARSAPSAWRRSTRTGRRG